MGSEDNATMSNHQVQMRLSSLVCSRISGCNEPERISFFSLPAHHNMKNRSWNRQTSDRIRFRWAEEKKEENAAGVALDSMNTNIRRMPQLEYSAVSFATINLFVVGVVIDYLTIRHHTGRFRKTRVLRTFALLIVLIQQLLIGSESL